MLSSSPFAQDPSRSFPEAERDFDLAFSAIRTVRSQAVSYNLNSKVQVFLHARIPALAKTIRDSSDALSVLIKGCQSFKVVEREEELPEGTVGELVAPELSAHLLLKVRLAFPSYFLKAFPPCAA